MTGRAFLECRLRVLSVSLIGLLGALLLVGCPPDVGLGAYSGPDADGDGLSDSYERAGWDMTITAWDGTTATRRVFGTLGEVDADGDGLTDAQEYAALCNSREYRR